MEQLPTVTVSSRRAYHRSTKPRFATTRIRGTCTFHLGPFSTGHGQPAYLFVQCGGFATRPPFYAKNPDVWRGQMECFFELYGVLVQQDRYYLMRELLPPSLASDLTEPGARPYDDLRTFLPHPLWPVFEATSPSR